MNTGTTSMFHLPITAKGAEIMALVSIVGSAAHLLPYFASVYAMVYYTIGLIDRHYDRKARSKQPRRKRG